MKRKHGVVASLVLVAGLVLSATLVHRDEAGEVETSRLHTGRATFVRPLTVAEALQWSKRYELRATELTLRYRGRGEVITAFYAVPDGASDASVPDAASKALSDGLQDLGATPSPSGFGAEEQIRDIARFKSGVDSKTAFVTDMTIHAELEALQRARRDWRVRSLVDQAVVAALVRREMEKGKK